MTHSHTRGERGQKSVDKPNEKLIKSKYSLNPPHMYAKTFLKKHQPDKQTNSIFTLEWLNILCAHARHNKKQENKKQNQAIFKNKTK